MNGKLSILFYRLYPVDKARVNEYGQSGEDEKEKTE